jgi:hypothetical protein
MNPRVYDAEKGELLLCYAQGIWLRLLFVVPLELIRDIDPAMVPVAFHLG